MSNAMVVFRQEMSQKMVPQFARVLPAHLPAERLARTIEGAVSADPKLLTVNRTSLWKSCMSAAVFGLEVDGRQSCIVRFKNSAQWIPMVSGLITLAYNSGFLLEGHIVREKDQFDYSHGLENMLIHKPTMRAGRGTDNPIIAAYALARPLVGGPAMFEVMELEDVLAIRDRSSGYKASKQYGFSSPWDTDFAPMARKTPIRQLANHLPWQVQKAVELEQRHDAGQNTWAEKPEGQDTIIIDGDVLEPEPEGDAAAEARANAAEEGGRVHEPSD